MWHWKIFRISILNIRDYFTQKVESSFFHLNLKNVAKLFNLNDYLILTLTLILTPQLSPNPNHKPHIKCVHASCADGLEYKSRASQILLSIAKQTVCTTSTSLQVAVSLRC